MKKIMIAMISAAVILAGTTVLADEFPVVVEAKVKAVLSAEREGVLAKLDVDTGDRVKKGAVLAEVFHKDLVYKKQQAEEKNKYLKMQLDNLSKLDEKGLATAEELARAGMELAVNEKDISIMGTQIARSEIKAPFSGIIVTRHVQPHEWVRPGQPVVELYDPNKLRVVADIPSDIAVKLKKKQKTRLFFPDLNKNFNASVAVFAPQVEVRSNTVKVYWKISDKSGKLIPGMKGVLKLGSE